MDGRPPNQSFHLSQSDAVAFLRSLPSESIDVVVTDPPYESLEKHRAIGTTTRLKHSKASSNDWFSIFPNSRFPELFAEVHRVLRRNTHFYLYCDPETMFVAKPLAEQAGFKFWKPLIWDKCLGPDTLVWTSRGIQRISAIVPGDRVAIPEGGTTEVRATRRTRAPAVRLTLSDGTQLIASRDHRFLLDVMLLAEAQELRSGSVLCTRPVLEALPVPTARAARAPDDDTFDAYSLDDYTAEYDFRRRYDPAAEYAAAYAADHAARAARAPLLRLDVDPESPSRLESSIERPIEPSNKQPIEHSIKHSIERSTTDRSKRFIERSIERPKPIAVVAIEDVGVQDLVDISIADRDELFLLANGVVTHNCKIGMGYHYRARYECILFFEKGKRKLNDLGIADIIEAPRISGGYPAEKPPSVSEVLIKQSTEPGQLVVDPFMGSGSVGVAALALGRSFYGNDLCAEAVQIARDRLVDGGGRELRGSPSDAVSAAKGQLGLSV